MSTIDQLTKRYRNTTAVDGLSFEVGPGRVTGFLGPNGAGKTTTSRMLLGLARPDGGTATINGARTPGHRGRRPRRLPGCAADRRLAGRAAPGRDLTHPPHQRWCPASGAAAVRHVGNLGRKALDVQGKGRGGPLVVVLRVGSAGVASGGARCWAPPLVGWVGQVTSGRSTTCQPAISSATG